MGNKVTQADRDAAHALYKAGGWELLTALPDDDDMVQAFARHRQQAIAQHEGGREKPWCSTCGKDVDEILCPECARWWEDNPPATRPTALAEDEVEALAKQIAKRTMKDLRIDRDTGMLYVSAVEAAKRAISHLSPRLTQQAEEQALLEAEVSRLRESFHNIIELARPYMRDEAQLLGLRLAEESLAALNEQPGGEVG